MHRLDARRDGFVCPNKVSVRERVRRTIEAAQDRLNASHHVIGEPAKV
jgi:UDP-glucuronate 4-epimerase